MWNKTRGASSSRYIHTNANANTNKNHLKYKYWNGVQVAEISADGRRAQIFMALSTAGRIDPFCPIKHSIKLNHEKRIQFSMECTYSIRQTWHVFVYFFSGVPRSTFCLQWLLLLSGPPKPRSVAGSGRFSPVCPQTMVSHLGLKSVFSTGYSTLVWLPELSPLACIKVLLKANFHPCLQIQLLRMASWSLKWWSRYKIHKKERGEYWGFIPGQQALLHGPEGELQGKVFTQSKRILVLICTPSLVRWQKL